MNVLNSKTYLQDVQKAANQIVNVERLFGKSILITGATGTIGSYIADILFSFNKNQNANIKIYLAGRSVDKLENRFKDWNTDFKTVLYDAISPVNFNFNVDYVIAAAGNAHPMAFNSDPVGTILGNINGTYNLLEYLRNCGGKRLLYVSSAEVYGKACEEVESFKEDYVGYVDITSSRSCYPNSKRSSETLCVSYGKQYGLETVIARPSHTFGPEITPSDSRAHAQFIRSGLKGENIILKSLGTQIRSYTYSADCATAILTVLINGESGQAYNIANCDARCSIAQLAKEIAEKSGTEVVFDVPNEKEVSNFSPFANQVLDSCKIERLGWKGQYSVAEGVQHTLMILKEIE